ncbi:MAG: relaxase/mobilization nuclease domain-containing protein [Clostridia bacterium]|nr:relaxase/mobilization nuclease domain-containing protein [Clostridia bacterium]
MHNHIIINSTTLDCTRKFRDFLGSARAMKRLNDTICAENGYSIVEHPKRKGKTYDVWQGETRIASRREQICKAIDAALPKTFLELLEMLRQMGYEIREHGEPALRGRDQKRFIRMDTLGEGYSVEILKTVIAGTRKHQTYSRTKTQQISLLIDVQAKLAEGKGIGCANWASRYNINQTARALSYLKEHGLLRYSTHPQIKENVKNGFVVGRYQQQF